jgi:hypothetical protein
MGRSARLAARLLMAVMAVALVACGDDDDDAGAGGDDDGEAREELVTALAGTGDEQFSEEESRCMAEALVDAVGVETLEEADVVTQIEENPDGTLSDWGVQLSDAQGEQLYTAANECVDLRALFMEGMTESGASAEAAECVSNAVDDEIFQRVIVLSLTEGEEALDGDAELTAAFQEAGTACSEELGGG